MSKKPDWMDSIYTKTLNNFTIRAQNGEFLTEDSLEKGKKEELRDCSDDKERKELEKLAACIELAIVEMGRSIGNIGNNNGR